MFAISCNPFRTLFFRSHAPAVHNPGTRIRIRIRLHISWEFGRCSICRSPSIRASIQLSVFVSGPRVASRLDVAFNELCHLHFLTIKSGSSQDPPQDPLPCQSKNICLQFAWLHARSILQAAQARARALSLCLCFSVSLRDWVSFSPLLTFGRGRFDVDYAKPIMKWLWGFDWQNIAGYKCAHTPRP